MLSSTQKHVQSDNEFWIFGGCLLSVLWSRGCCDNLFHKFHFGRVWGVSFLHKHCRHNLLYFIEKHFNFIAVVYVGRRYCIIQNQLAFSINLNMILVTVMCFITFFRPTGIGIFLKLFVGQFISFSAVLSFFCLHYIIFCCLLQ